MEMTSDEGIPTYWKKRLARGQIDDAIPFIFWTWENTDDQPQLREEAAKLLEGSEAFQLSSPIRLNVANLFSTANCEAKAEEILSTLVREKFAPAYVELGKIHYQNDRIHRALVLFSQASDLDYFLASSAYYSALSRFYRWPASWYFWFKGRFFLARSTLRASKMGVRDEARAWRELYRT